MRQLKIPQVAQKLEAQKRFLKKALSMLKIKFQCAVEFLNRLKSLKAQNLMKISKKLQKFAISQNSEHQTNQSFSSQKPNSQVLLSRNLFWAYNKSHQSRRGHFLTYRLPGSNKKVFKSPEISYNSTCKKEHFDLKRVRVAIP